jgi:outer membrane protein insertion porin family
VSLLAAAAVAQDSPNGLQILPPRTEVNIASGLAGRTVERVEVRGNQTIPTGTILNLVRTRVGDALDPLTVQDDYQRIYELRRFGNVEAQIQPTQTGVVVAFIVTEQKAIKSVQFRGNIAIDTQVLSNSITIRPNESIDNFRISLAKRAIQQMYQTKNYPLSSVNIDSQALSERGELIFLISEGPNVRIRNIDFIGNASFPEGQLKKKIQARTYIPIARPGTLNEESLDDDAASVRDFYRSKGFFDARVGRRILFSADQSEAQVEFLVDEGPRYVIEKVTFQGNTSLSEAQLRERLRLVEGMPFDREARDADVRKLVDAYAPFGFIVGEPTDTDPDYLRIEPSQRFRAKPGTIELVYNVDEGKPFKLGAISVAGNSRTQDKVVLREFRGFAPGSLFDATTIREATARLRNLGLFDRVKVTPVGEKPEERDLIVEVDESKTATLTFGAGVNSNGGISGNITYTQRNFDITNWPNSLREVFDETAFVGAGQNFRASFEPGTVSTNASLRWTDPYIFDQPYSFTGEAYLRNRRREDYLDQRIGGRATLGHRFNDFYSASIGARGETIKIYDINDEPIRAFEILDEEGNHVLTSLTLSGKRDTTNPGPLPYRGTTSQTAWESYGALGGDYTFQKFTASFDFYHELHADLVDRKTILALHADTGYITGDSPFFERFYGGGIGSVRGFSFRGISPRSGPDDDRIGGEFSLTGSAEVSFPLVSDQLRGVVFTDIGTVESDLKLGTIRSSVGAGFRITLPLMGQVPIAIDFAYPLTEDDQDDTQLISFSLGFIP